MEGKNRITLYKGHIKDTQNSIEIGDFLSNDPQLLLIYKKTERLATATYMITDLFNDQEPLKWELRKKSVLLLSFITELPQAFDRTDGGDSVSGVQKALSHILFPLELAMQIGLISQMNFSILKDEFISLGDLLKRHRSSVFSEGDFTFPANFFSYEKDNVLEEGGEKEDSKGHNVKRGVGGVVQNAYLKRQKKTTSDIKKTHKTNTIPVAHSQGSEIKDVKDGRRNAIIRLLKTKGELTIREITSVISGWSEKTIQRELMSLIAGGSVQKKGERRWSKYSIKAIN